ncbi:STAS domain-containing protein [Hamadaea sp. NPDC051192]|uniref:STAS domain-containing protein n=1 Tax=Hamadaea sp. NPDC051192 TaxID=3154940 RepID=UPI003429B4BF
MCYVRERDKPVGVEPISASSWQFTVDDHDETRVIALSGEFDAASAGQLRQMLAVYGQATPHTVVDLRDVTFLDCSIVTVLLQTRASTACNGRCMSVRHPTGSARRVLAMTGVLPLLTESPVVYGTQQPHDHPPVSGRRRCAARSMGMRVWAR